MAHPSYEQVNFETMANVSDPQTDREWLIKIGSDINRLSEAIEGFAEKLELFEETRLKEFEKRIKDLEKWQSEWGGVWKFIVIIGAVLGILAIVVKLIWM